MLIFNHALKHDPTIELTWLKEEARFVGFYAKPLSEDEVRRGCASKTFLNFDDAAWGEGLPAFLAARFPEKSKFER